MKMSGIVTCIHGCRVIFLLYRASRPYYKIGLISDLSGVLVKLVITSACHAEGRGFESRTPRQSFINTGFFPHKKITIDVLKSETVQVMFSHSTGPENPWSIWQALDGEVEFNSKTYLLVDGSWYEADRNTVAEANRIVDGIESFDIVVPRAYFGESEKHYNERLSRALRGSALMDFKLVRGIGFGSPIEVCDVLTSEGDFIHMKMGVRSSTLSHLLLQGLNSMFLMLTSEDYRREVIGQLKKMWSETLVAKVIPPKNIDPRAYRVIYGMVTHKSGPLSKVLPFFSRVSLMNTYGQLKAMGVDVRVLLVGLTSKPLLTLSKDGNNQGQKQSEKPLAG
jgi:uncharacterized protein (TIGR04141 family)